MSQRQGALYALIAFAGVSAAAAQTKDTEWPTYGADLANTRYRPLDQINAVQLQPARAGLELQDRQPGHPAGVSNSKARR